MVRQDYSSEMLNGLFRLHFGYRFDRFKVEWIWEAKEKAIKDDLQEYNA